MPQQTNLPNNLNHVLVVTEEVEKEVLDMFQYHPWNADQVTSGTVVRTVLAEAVIAILRNVPPCPDRSAAIRKIREARMDCNSAITHQGRY